MCDKQGSLFVPPLILMRHTKKNLHFVPFLSPYLFVEIELSHLPLRMAFPTSDEICPASTSHPSPLLQSTLH
jgi:hypothetical protein